jgi:hypothetical protein
MLTLLCFDGWWGDRIAFFPLMFPFGNGILGHFVKRRKKKKEKNNFQMKFLRLQPRTGFNLRPGHSRISQIFYSLLLLSFPITFFLPSALPWLSL